MKNLIIFFRRWFLSEIYIKLELVLMELDKMSVAFDLMLAKVNELKEVDTSILALIDTLVANIQNAATLEEAQQIVAEIEGEKQKLAAAVLANTPSA
jgi:hypothetical protein